MYEDRTTAELKKLRDQYSEELFHKKESLWRAIYYCAGLLAVMGAVVSILSRGLDLFSAALLAFGAPACWMWHKDDQYRLARERHYRELVNELEKRPDGHC